MVNEVFKRLSCRDEDFLFQILVITLTLALPLIPERHTHTFIHTAYVSQEEFSEFAVVTCSNTPR